jgi:hypothetical protein
MPKKKPRLLVLTVGFAAVAAWMIVDQFVMGRLESHVQDYMRESGTFFKDMDRINIWGDNVRNVSKMVIFGMMGIMLFIIAATARIRPFQLLLALIPGLLPVFFVITYAGWLWFFGHNMHPWGAFTVKPFMPTVFGEGKVAQFSTFSYPYWGYGLLITIFICMMLALLIRRKQLREGTAE